MNLITVIPARGGSKSIPLKNIRTLKGKPLIAYSINYSKRCPLISRTIVSTDSQEIADIAKQYDAEIPFIRPDKISGDEVQDFPVVEHALKFLESELDEIIDAIVWLRPTSPFRPPMLIEKAVDLLKKFPECSSIRSIVPSTEHPFRQWKLESGFIKTPVNETNINEPYNLPRQKLPKMFFQSGDIEVVRRSTILAGSISGKKIVPLILSKKEMLDIDNFSDLENAENKIVDDV